VEYILNTNEVIFWEDDHKKVRSYMGGIVQGKETKKLNVVDVLYVQELI
jgi:hypothetical protein